MYTAFNYVESLRHRFTMIVPVNRHYMISYGKPVKHLSIPKTILAVCVISIQPGHRTSQLGFAKETCRCNRSEEEGEVKGKSNYGQIWGSGLMSYTVLLGLSYS